MRLDDLPAVPSESDAGWNARRGPLFLTRAGEPRGQRRAEAEAGSPPRRAGRAARRSRTRTAAETGLPGRPKTSVAPFVAKRTGFAGRIATLWKRIDAPAACEGRRDEVVVAGRDAAGREEEIVAALQSAAQSVVTSDRLRRRARRRGP